MKPRYDLVIRGGTVVDGSGGEPFHADIGIRNGLIAAVGVVSDDASETINATGCIVTPGFVDIHTHYDAQVVWDNHLGCSSSHGVTSVVMGNCAVGLAPCKPDQRDLLVKVMSGVEDIPEVVMVEGLEWKWETFPQYLDLLETRRCDVDFAAQLAHAPLRVYVMGQRGADREPATIDDLRAMTAITTEALKAGALGFSTSRLPVHRSNDGKLAPAETAGEEELMAIARGIRESGLGVIDYVSEYSGLPYGSTADFDLMRRFAEAAGRPLSYTLYETMADSEGWRSLVELTKQANADGVRMRCQVAPRAIGVHFGLDLSYNPFSFRPSYAAIADLPLDKRVSLMRDPQLRERILSEKSVPDHTFMMPLAELVGNMFVLDPIPDYEPPHEKRIDTMAAAAGKTPAEYAYDALLEEDGKSILYLPAGNYVHGNLESTREMMSYSESVIALGDGGAHLGMICDASYPTFSLTHWTRDRAHGRIPLQQLIRNLTRQAAETVGLLDRGLVKAGYKADLNIIDFERLTLHRPEARYDLPAGGRRMWQRADGYVATIVSGVATFREGQATGELPGRLVRGARRDPAAA